MPSVADVMSYADYLRVSPVIINEDHCVAVRNRNATCRQCAEACLADAITVDRNEATVDATACVNCGVCASLCPTFAISLEDPTRAETLASALKASDRASGMCVVACGRAAAWHEADVERFAEVPCLGHVSDGLLVDIASAGLDDIVLVDGGCATCKFGAASPYIDGSVDTAADLLEAAGAEVVITRASEFPAEVKVSKGQSAIRGEDRRGLLFKTGGYVKRVAGNVAQKTLEDKLGGAQKPRTLKDRLSAGKSGRMPTFEPQGNFRLIEGMERAGADAEALAVSDEPLSTRRFGHITIDAEACSGCGLCVLFCPTAALSHAEFDVPKREDRKYLEFSAELCTQCGMCRDVCIRRCLDLDGHVRVKDVFDLEPALIEIARPKERTSLFDLKKR